jgi:hypothetical protein
MKLLKPQIVSNHFILIQQSLCERADGGYSAVTSRINITGGFEMKLF